MIVLDAAAVPDFYSGARTRLRGLVGGYATLADAPALTVRIARGATLLEGVALGTVAVEEVARPGGPVRRALRHAAGRAPPGDDAGALARSARLWHSETIPPLGPRRVPALVTIHDLRWLEPRAVTGASWPKWAGRHLAVRCWLPRLARQLAGIVTVSSASARRIEQALKLPPERVHVIPNAVSDGPPSRLGVAEEKALLAGLGVAHVPFFLAVGHLEPRKGLELAIAALAAMGGSAKLLLVGEGPARAALAEQARGRGLGDRILFAGRRSDEAVQSLQAHAAALLFPSLFEGFGFPVHEALAQGTPVLASRLDVFTEIDDPRLVLLPREVGAWARAMAGLAAKGRAAAVVEDPRTRARVDPGTVHAADRSWTASAVALAGLYRRLGLAP